MLFQSYIDNRERYPIELISSILDKLNSVYVSQIDFLHTKDVSIKAWQHPFEALSFKLSSHIASLQMLLSKSSIPYQGRRLLLLDIASINILTRAIIENYLTLYHFHFDPVSDEQKSFRHLIYMISALKNRQLFTSKEEENKQQREIEKMRIQELQEDLKINPYFQSLPEKNQEHYLNTKDAKQLNWIDLLEHSDLKPEFFKDIWRLLSNYAHSEFLGIMQIREHPKNPEQLNDNSYFMAELSAMVLGKSITNAAILFPICNEIIDKESQDTSNLIEYFSKIGTKGST